MLKPLILTIATGLIAATSTVALSLAMPETPFSRYDLIAVYSDGESDIIDYDLSATDCSHATLTYADDNATTYFCDLSR